MYYSIRDCGDGSAYPVFFETREAAEVDQESQVILTGMGWGDDCSGKVDESPTTNAQFVKELEAELEYLEGNQKEELEALINRLR